MVRISQECCRLVRTQIIAKQRSQQVIDDLLIDTAILDQALSNLQNAMEITLSKSDRNILATIYRNSRPDDPKEQEFLDLLHNTYTIECRNGNKGVTQMLRKSSIETDN